jgi:hypothetical protein
MQAMVKEITDSCGGCRKNRGRFKPRFCVTANDQQVELFNKVLDRIDFANLSHAVCAGLTHAYNQIVPPEDRIPVDPFVQLVFARRIQVKRIGKPAKAMKPKGKK